MKVMLKNKVRTKFVTIDPGQYEAKKEGKRYLLTVTPHLSVMVDRKSITEIKSCPKVAVYVSGGNVQSVVANTEDVVVEVFDVDNLKAEGMTAKEIDAIWDKKFDECHHAIY